MGRDGPADGLPLVSSLVERYSLFDELFHWWGWRGGVLDAGRRMKILGCLVMVGIELAIIVLSSVGRLPYYDTPSSPE